MKGDTEHMARDSSGVAHLSDEERAEDLYPLRLGRAWKLGDVVRMCVSSRLEAWKGKTRSKRLSLAVSGDASCLFTKSTRSSCGRRVLSRLNSQCPGALRERRALQPPLHSGSRRAHRGPADRMSCNPTNVISLDKRPLIPLHTKDYSCLISD